jgi:hypothetical protein
MVYKTAPLTAFESETQNFNIDNLSIGTLLFQTGYLTVKGYDTVGRVILDYPNREVELSMTQHILQAFTYLP